MDHLLRKCLIVSALAHGALLPMFVSLRAAQPAASAKTRHLVPIEILRPAPVVRPADPAAPPIAPPQPVAVPLARTGSMVHGNGAGFLARIASAARQPATATVAAAHRSADVPTAWNPLPEVRRSGSAGNGEASLRPAVGLAGPGRDAATAGTGSGVILAGRVGSDRTIGGDGAIAAGTPVGSPSGGVAGKAGPGSSGSFEGGGFGSKATPSMQPGWNPAPLPRHKELTGEPAPAAGHRTSPTGSGGAPDSHGSGGPSHGVEVAASPRPPYPPAARAAGIEGVVRLRVHVTPNGSVANVDVVSSSGHAMLDEQAARFVRSSWAFRPALRDGNPQAGAVTVRVEFQLR